VKKPSKPRLGIKNTHQSGNEKSITGSFVTFLKDIRLLFGLLRDYWKGEYRDVSWLTIASLVAMLLYMFSPIDLNYSPNE